ncbi:MAG TPA: orotidine-5'-phosphate decarboxylase [Syntrophales bacterium]|nr:orotidine-5'-phosphate decarboxylase [Syntrophales bacterium]
MMRSTLSKNPREMLIFALDGSKGIEEAMAWIKRLRDQLEIFKVGKESYTRYGPYIVQKIIEGGKKVFLDLKFHDIPNTVAGAAVGAVQQGVYMFNVHALGGREMMEKTVAAVNRAAQETALPRPIILAVTVLTSLNDGDLEQMGFNGSAREVTLRLARLAMDSGISGVIASARDIADIRRVCGNDFIIVTPGIREATSAIDDQKRISTVRDAIARGADYIVVGRPIIQAADPVQKVEEIVSEITEGLIIRQKAV